MIKKSITKIVLITVLLTSLLSTNANALSSQQELACTVLLCLSASGGTRPHECNAPIRKFLRDTLNPRKVWKTITNRKNFLKMCPTGTNPQINQVVAGLDQDDEDTKKFDELVNALSQVQPEQCTTSYLNTHIDIKRRKGLTKTEIITMSNDSNIDNPHKIIGIRPAILNPACKTLYKHSYMDGLKEPKNICKTQEWYTFQDWLRGYKLQVISRAVYLKLNENERDIKHLGPRDKLPAGADIVEHIDLGDQSYTKYALHYKKIFINKKCWVD